MNELLFGTAGIPLSTNPYNTIEGIKQVKRLGLSAMELEFVQSINISEEQAPAVKEISSKEKIALTCHGQYFINLNAVEKAKLEASKRRIYLAAKRAFHCGAWSVCFHPGFYLKQEPKKVFEKVKAQLKETISKLKEEGVKIWVRPETTGKATQFGSLEEIVDLSLALDQVQPCIDFSHLHARTNGKVNSREEFSQVLQLIEKKLGKEGLTNMHIHAQGVEYSQNGEKRHLPFSEADLNYTDLVRAWKEFKIKGVVICESPIMEKDTAFLQKQFTDLK